MKFNTIITISYVTAILCSLSCTKLESDTPQPLAPAPVSYAETDPGFQLAKSLATAMQDTGVRRFVKQKANERFDGDFNFLYALEKSAAVGGKNSRSLTFEEVLFGKGAADSRRARVLAHEPLLQVALRRAPGVTQDWDPEYEHPVVVYLPYGTNPDEVSSLPAFDEWGNLYDFDTQTYPTAPIIVISHNERVKTYPRTYVDKVKGGATNSTTAPDDGCILTSEPLLADEENFYYLTSDCGGSGPPYLPGEVEGGEETNETCHREGTTLYDHISRVKFADMGGFQRAEDYFHGAPELYFFVFTGSNQGHLQSFQKFIPIVDRSEWKDCPLFSECYTEWHYPDLEVMFWDKEEYTEKLKYQWFEQDLGDPVKFTTSYNTKLDDGSTATVSFEVTISDKDYNLGHSLVDYCEDATAADYKVYETGRLFYALELR